MKSLPRVAILGKPNVGKSTLFNRVVGKRKAIVHSLPGVTRDIQVRQTEWNGVAFFVIDTGGLFSDKEDPLVKEVENRAFKQAVESDAVIMLTDAKGGLAPVDEKIAATLRRSEAKVFLAVNKCEGLKNAGSEFFRLGFDPVYEISALHGSGIGDLLDDVVSMLPRRKKEPEEQEFRIAVVGIPNVGKSSLINKLAQKDAHIVNEKPGTTRDCLDITIRWHGNEYTFVDTAGIKRRAKTKDAVSSISAVMSIDTISRADAVIIMLDASSPITRQDVRVGSYAHKEGRGVLICVNKWDLLSKNSKLAAEFERTIRDKMTFLSYAPILFISALTGQRVSKIFPALGEIREARAKHIPTAKLNDFIGQVVSSHPPPFHSGGTGKIYYGTQTDISPPCFTLFVNQPAFFHRSYLRFLNNRLREEYSFPGTLIRINLVGKKRRR